MKTTKMILACIFCLMTLALSQCVNMKSTITSPALTLESSQEIVTPEIPSMFTATTSQQVISPTPVAQSGEVEFLGFPLLLQYNQSGRVLLQDISTGKTRHLSDNLRIYEPGYFLRWTQNGCAFLLFKDMDIVEVNLKGDVIRTVYKNTSFQYLGKTILYPGVNLSPSEIWITFMVSSGEQIGHPISGVYYQQQDLFIKSVNGNSNPIQITQRGGAYIGKWAPDSKKKAYSDFDQNGNYQIYVADVNGKSVSQLTHFASQFWPTQISWSPNSQNLVLLAWDDKQYPEYYLVSLTGSQELDLGKIDYHWWEDDSTLGVWNKNNIQWINPTSQEIVRDISTAPDPKGYISRLGTLDQFGCFGGCFGIEGNQMSMYDISLQKMVNYPNVQIYPEYINWFATPKEFKGEVFCEDTDLKIKR